MEKALYGYLSFSYIIIGFNNLSIGGERLFHNLEAGKLQQQLLLARIAEADGCLAVLAGSLHLDHLAHSEAFVLYHLTCTHILRQGSCRRRP